MQSRLYKTGWKVLDLLFPPKCAGCGKWGERYCAACLKKSVLIPAPICQICGDPLPDGGEVICVRCRTQQVAYTAVRSWAVFEEPLQSAIHQLKYRQDRGLGEVLALPMIDIIKKYMWDIDLVIPVPLDDARRKERGYNQAALLARPISWETGIPYKKGILNRIKVTRQQVGLNITERRENMSGAFQADRDQVSGKRMLVVDDVITTGATLNACAHALISAGAERVFGLTLARSSYN